MFNPLDINVTSLYLRGEIESPAVQAIIARWRQHMRYFYEPGVEVLRGLGQMYVDSPEFADKFCQLHPRII